MIEHRMNIRVTKDDFNEHGEIKASSLLYFFQEAAAEHADRLNVGYEDMIKNNRIWIVTKLKYRVLAELKSESDYYVMTYPKAKRSRVCPRDYYIYDMAGNLMVIGSGLWSIIDYKSRKLERIDFEYDGMLKEEAAFEEGFERLHMKEPAEAGSYQITPSDLDVNDHTNNCRYADLVQQICGIKNIREFSIQFSKETRLGDEILLYKEEGRGRACICGKLSDGKQVFLAQVKEESRY